MTRTKGLMHLQTTSWKRLTQGKMVGHQWLPWINNPTPVALTTASKQEREKSSRYRGKLSSHCSGPVITLSLFCVLLFLACVALSIVYSNESDSLSLWKNRHVNDQNVSESYQTLSTANSDLKRDNDILKKHHIWLEEQSKVLNTTSAELRFVNLALSLETSHLMEQVHNLTSANQQIQEERDRLLKNTIEQEEQRLNMSQSIRDLGETSMRLHEEKHRLSEMISLLKAELLYTKEEKQEHLENNTQCQQEIQNLSRVIAGTTAALKEHEEEKQKLSVMLIKQQQEAAEQWRRCKMEAEQAAADMHYLQLYCPVVNQRTKERVCKKCQDSWRIFQTKCYYFSPEILTWSSSRAWCQTQGGDLLIINSEEEQHFVFENSQAAVQGGRLWIGMTDAEEEGDWLWMDGSRVTSNIQYWLNRQGLNMEPDNWKMEDPLGEDCGHLDTNEDVLHSWMDGSCQTAYHWICEKKL